MKNKNEERRECRGCRECRGFGECRAAAMQDLYARRRITQKQPYGKSPDIYLSGVKCSLDKARQKSSATFAFQEQRRPKRSTKDDGRWQCMNGRTVGSIMLPKRGRMAASSQALSVIGALHCLRVREISHTSLRATFPSSRSLSLACYTVPEGVTL